MYFKSCLSKDAEWFDINNPTEMASRIAKKCSAIERGVGDKIGSVFQGVSSTICGFSFAFIWGWKLSLILLVGIPFLGMMGVVMALMMKKGISENMKAYAQSSGYAD